MVRLLSTAYNETAFDIFHLEASQGQVEVANRSGWQTVLMEASGIGAAISEENMKRLKYCLEWLQV